MSERFSAEDRDRVLRMGPVICMRIAEKRTRKEVGGTIFKAGTMIDTTYFDKEEIADPMRSDMPLMQAMVRAGYYSPPDENMMADHLLFTWKITEAGRAALLRAQASEQSGG